MRIIRTMFAKFAVKRQWVTPGGKVLLSCKKISPYLSLMYNLPYGICTKPDGTEVLFNRDYEPIYERKPGGKAQKCNDHSKESIGIDVCKEKKTFYRDGTPITKRIEIGEDILAEWALNHINLCEYKEIK